MVANGVVTVLKFTSNELSVERCNGLHATDEL